VPQGIELRESGADGARLDEGDDVLGGGAGEEDGGDAGLLESGMSASGMMPPTRTVTSCMPFRGEAS